MGAVWETVGGAADAEFCDPAVLGPGCELADAGSDLGVGTVAAGPGTSAKSPHASSSPAHPNIHAIIVNGSARKEPSTPGTDQRARARSESTDSNLVQSW